jgi:DNA-directed RNA polymerase subunit alpha
MPMSLLDRSIEEFDFSARAFHCLKNANIRTLRELVSKTEAELLMSKHFGRISIADVKRVLTKMRLHLGMRNDDDNGGPVGIEKS